MSDELQLEYDVVVVGGGPAGLNGALMLARSRRSVVVLDAGAPRNAPAAAVHGLLGREGMPPGDLLARGRAEVRQYGGHVVEAEVADARPVAGGFAVDLADGRHLRARRVLVATGLVDRLPEVPGLVERWGRDVLHCPYCHGWEVRDQAIAVLGTGPMSVHQALLFSQLSDDVAYVVHDVAPTEEEAARLAALGVGVVTERASGLEVVDDRISGVRLADGSVLACEAVVVATRMEARIAPVVGLGLAVEEHASGVGSFVPADATGRSAVPGVWVAGNVSDVSAQVGASAAQGAMAGAVINADLVTEDGDRALAAVSRS